MGDGGSSRVYKGFIGEKKVAVKQLKFYSPRFTSSLMAAYEGLFELSHGNVVQVLGICPKEGHIIMEYCEKNIDGIIVRTLADMQLQFGTSLPIDLRITAIADVADGIHYLHAKNVIHGDIKPLNVLVCGEGDEFCFKITDYACVGNKIATPSSSKSVTIKQLMTPAYMAPESFSNDGSNIQPTKSSDIYSLGILAYEIILGVDPWKNVSFDLIERVKHGYRPVIPERAPEDIVCIIKKCWLHEHLLRPTALDVSNELEHHLDTNNESNGAEVNELFNDDIQTSSSVATETTNDSSLKEVLNPSISVASSSQSNPKLSDSTDVSHASSVLPPSDMAHAKSLLNIRELKEFQTECLAAVNRGDDVILVQPTGSGKSVCFVLPALLFPGKVSLVVEPVVAIIINQVEMLQRKGIDAIALGNAASSKRSANFRRLFREPLNLPRIVFCTPEYLFGTPSCGTYSGTSGQFHSFVSNSSIFCMVAIDEVHKVFDRMSDYRPAFDNMKQLKELSCPIIAMSATLTDKQINDLKKEYVRGDNCIVLTNSVSRDNLQISLQRYRRRRYQPFADNICNYHDDDDSDDNDYNDIEHVTILQSTQSSSASMWGETVSKVLPLMKNQSTVLYLDFVKDVEDITDIVKRGDVNVGKYTGRMNVEERKQAEKNFLQGSYSVLVATESYELGVDNPNVTQVIRIGCPRNLGVLLQELGRAGRKPNSTASGLLLFNEVQDDKRLGVWLKSAIESIEVNAHIEQAKSEVINNYVTTWKFIYSMYHGKCLSRSLALLYGGAGDIDPPTCFISNSPLCTVCAQIDHICQWSIDIQPFLSTLLRAVEQLHAAGLPRVTKTLLISILLQCNEDYVRSFDVLCDLLDQDSETCWGSGLYVNDIRVSRSSWHKVIYVAVYLGCLDIIFDFRPYENHHEVHRKYFLAAAGEAFLQDPIAIMSLDPLSNVVDIMLGVVEKKYSKCHQNRGKQLKPRLIAALEGCLIEGNVEKIKFLGLGTEAHDDMCFYFHDCSALPEATRKPHYLLNVIQFSRSQAGIKPIRVNIDGVETELMAN